MVKDAAYLLLAVEEERVALVLLRSRQDPKDGAK